ncbi:lipid phosphate phosphatase epsilon 2, chloroplastic-like [Durio zibethinus]|uniref:Lipid phosphate phosphatase epsilon 2, chloroplastic-like n=1 Tax=Durio zibethinus TaxID=66656 RepID=A0A6P5ZEZ8_DURZI|nr:lipid phosphate phosphatase epsilon 2, chloroplastic-like [Durio zibethinus]
MIKTSVLRDSRNRDDGLQVLEQEAFINRPTLNRLSKWLVAALFGGVLIWRHDAEALWMAMGSIANGLLSVTLKRVLNYLGHDQELVRFFHGCCLDCCIIQ